MKVNIVFDFKTKIGGGYSFLNSLREKLIGGDYYGSAINSDIILFNLNPQNFKKNYLKIILFKTLFKKRIVFRIDGPIYLYRGKDKHIDLLFIDSINQLADGVIFQSYWSKKQLIKLGLNKDINSTVIYNGCNQAIFYPLKKNKKLKTEIIISSWSDNENKGFEFYRYLDEQLDFNNYNVTFVGPRLKMFKNIKEIGKLNSSDLSQKLKESDIYITASKNDPCSNSLIEALSSGLKCFALNSGGHPELINKKSFLFNNKDEMLNLIKSNKDEIQFKNDVFDIKNVCQKYILFFQSLSKFKLRKNKFPFGFNIYFKFFYNKLYERFK